MERYQTIYKKRKINFGLYENNLHEESESNSSHNLSRK